jgi:hypothetical protein
MKKNIIKKNKGERTILPWFEHSQTMPFGLVAG